MKAYIGNTPKRGTHIVVAELMSDGDEYRVVYAEAESRLLPAIIFEETYHELTWHERQLLEQTDAEHQVSAISDGEPVEDRLECAGWLPGQLDVERDEKRCARCNTPESDHWMPAPTRILDTLEKVDEWNKEHQGEPPMKLGDTVRIRRW